MSTQTIVQYSSHTSFITGVMTSAYFSSHIGKVDRNNTGNNAEGDKAQICNCATKGVVQGRGANKIANGIVTASQAAHGVQQIKTRFHHLNKVHPHECQAHQPEVLMTMKSSCPRT